MIRCSKCGHESKGLETCKDIDERLNELILTSQYLKSITEIVTKCYTILCLNNLEYTSGMESTDKVLEEDGNYHLLQEQGKTKYLLIVIHDGESGQMSNEEKLFKKVLGSNVTQILEEIVSKCHAA
jgi:hypothetical protein